jgi:hypothetical protein
LRPIKEKIVINIEVTPDKTWNRLRCESDAGDVEYKNFARQNAHSILEIIKRDVQWFLEEELPEKERDHMLEISANCFDEDPEYEAYSCMVKEVKVTWVI